jgi:hypothetical protein
MRKVPALPMKDRLEERRRQARGRCRRGNESVTKLDGFNAAAPSLRAA